MAHVFRCKLAVAIEDVSDAVSTVGRVLTLPVAQFAMMPNLTRFGYQLSLKPVEWRVPPSRTRTIVLVLTHAAQQVSPAQAWRDANALKDKLCHVVCPVTASLRNVSSSDA